MRVEQKFNIRDSLQTRGKMNSSWDIDNIYIYTKRKNRKYSIEELEEKLRKMRLHFNINEIRDLENKLYYIKQLRRKK